MPDEAERLRRQLRALAAMNHQLRAQVEDLRSQLDERADDPTGRREVDPLHDPAPRPAPAGSGPRRAEVAGDWIADLATAEAATPGPLDASVVARPDGVLFVIDRGRRRRLRSSLLAPALEDLLGARRPVTDDEVAAWDEGPPIEVLEGPTGSPFVVLAGWRLPVLRLPLPHPVAEGRLDHLPEGPALDASLRPPPPAPPPPDPNRLMQEVIERKGGLAPTAVLLARFAAHRAKSQVKGSG